MNEEQYAEIIGRQMANDKEHEAYNRRLKDHDEHLARLDETYIALERLTSGVNALTASMGDLKTVVQSVDRRVAALETEPAEKWKKVTYEILKWAVIGILTFAAGCLYTAQRGA